MLSGWRTVKRLDGVWMANRKEVGCCVDGGPLRGWMVSGWGTVKRLDAVWMTAGDRQCDRRSVGAAEWAR